MDEWPVKQSLRDFGFFQPHGWDSFHDEISSFAFVADQRAFLHMSLCVKPSTCNASNSTKTNSRSPSIVVAISVSFVLLLMAGG